MVLAARQSQRKRINAGTAAHGAKVRTAKAQRAKVRGAKVAVRAVAEPI